MHEYGTALRGEVWAVLLLQTLHVGDVAEEHGVLPARIDLARARNGVLPDVVERPVRGENLISPAAEEEIEPLLEDMADLFAKHSIEVGHHPAAELEAPG